MGIEIASAYLQDQDPCQVCPSDRAVYLFAFAKNERENIGHGELVTLREIAATLFKARTEEIATAPADGTLIEVHNGEEGKEDGKS